VSKKGVRLHARVKHVRKERANDRRARARRAQPRGAARRESQRLKQRAAVRLRCGGTGEGVGRAAGAGRSERRLFFLEERERVLLHPICVALVMMQGWGTAACLHRGVLNPPPHRAHRRALRRRPRIAQQPVPRGPEAQLPHPEVRAPQLRQKLRVKLRQKLRARAALLVTHLPERAARALRQRERVRVPPQRLTGR
jgi:hypothetical protein